ncbi:MAG: extracellular solute-binding protein [Oscillochloris sp.]|nr:extracellular solute-binding protein [Oscillochloris sp.]
MAARQHIRHLLVICLALLSLVACAGAGAPGAVSAPVPTAATVERGRTVLVLWHAWPAPRSQVLASLVERYNRSHPSVQVVLQAHSVATISGDLAQAISEGGGPHMALLQSHTIGSLAEAGALLPLDDLVSDADLSQLLAAAVGAARLANTSGGALYGLPISFDTLALYYSRANFASAPPSDTNSLLVVARGLTDTQSDPPTWGLALNLSLDRTIGYLYAFGGRVFDEQHTLVLGGTGRAGTEAWLSWLVSLHSDTRILASTDGITIDHALMSRQALMTFDWAHALLTYSDLWQEHLGVAPLPKLSDGNQAPKPYVQSDVIALNARIGTAERQATVDFVRYLLSAEAQSGLLQAGLQPTLISLDLATVEGVSAPIRAAALVFRSQAEQGLPMPNSREANDLVWTTLSDMHTNTLRRLLSPAQAVSDADTILRARLGRMPYP